MIVYLFVSCLLNIFLLMKYSIIWILHTFYCKSFNTIIDYREENRLNKNQQKEKSERITSIYRNSTTLGCCSYCNYKNQLENDNNMDGSIVNLLEKYDIPKSKIPSILRIILIHNQNKNCKIEKKYIH